MPNREAFLGIALVPHIPDDKPDWKITLKTKLGVSGNKGYNNLETEKTFSKNMEQSFTWFSLSFIRALLVENDSVKVSARLETK